jgi:hypothetical protein
VILANDPDRKRNAQAIADLAELGWLRPDDLTLDMTIGPKAGFWQTWRPRRLVTNDTDPTINADHHQDARHMDFDAGTFDVTVFDPPYGYRGTSALASDANYGVSTYTPAKEIDALLAAGTAEAVRLTRRLALVKCQDSCVASTFHDQSTVAIDAARSAGARVVGKVYVNSYRKQPPKRQLNVWGYSSVLLMLEVAP